MKDDLHELIDGGLPDEQAAELLHLLSVDPEKRSVFRSQMRLQKNLCRNERHASMSSLEEGEMLDRISRAVGEPTAGAGRVARRGVLMLALGFLVGSGAGYVGHSLMADPAYADGPRRDTVRIVEQAPATTPQVLNINRDSVVAAIKDSLAKAEKVAAVTQKKTTRAQPKRKTPKRRGHPDTGGY
jgi:hypothetical protein